MLHDDGFELVPVSRLYQLMRDNPRIMVKYAGHSVYQIDMVRHDEYTLIDTLTGWQKQVAGRARLETYDPAVYKWGSR